MIRTSRFAWAASALALCLLAGGQAHADHHEPDEVGHGQPALHADPGGHEGSHTAHEGGHGGHEEADQEINWSYGFVGEKDGVEPSLLYRPKGMPAPFLANVFNAVMLFTIIIVAGRKPIAEGLRKRKQAIVQGMEEAGKMKSEAASQLGEYEARLAHLDQDVERIRREMREAADAERVRILAEAKERRERMERDARLLVEQELKAAREALTRETVRAAMKTAEELVAKELATADHDRLARDYLETLRQAPLGTSGVRQ